MNTAISCLSQHEDSLLGFVSSDQEPYAYSGYSRPGDSFCRRNFSPLLIFGIDGFREPVHEQHHGYEKQDEDNECAHHKLTEKPLYANHVAIAYAAEYLRQPCVLRSERLPQPDV